MIFIFIENATTTIDASNVGDFGMGFNCILCIINCVKKLRQL